MLKETMKAYHVDEGSEGEHVITFASSSAQARQRITTYMSCAQGSNGWFCTWWFKFYVAGARDTPEIRRELERMERDGLVESDRSQSNNSKWKLMQKASELTP